MGALRAAPNWRCYTCKWLLRTKNVMSMKNRSQIRIGLVGYGEIGSTIGRGLRDAGMEHVVCYDNQAFEGPFAGLIQSRAAAAGVAVVRTPHEFAAGVEMILGFTPGSSSLESAQSFAPLLKKHHTFIDFASATPKIKLGVAEHLQMTGAMLADGSIMGTPLNGYAMPMLASGPAAQLVTDVLVPWGMQIDFAGERLGTASGVKILRSVLFKGIEALTDEMLLAARAYGMDEVVLMSAAKSLARPWMEMVESLIPSGVIHARRRAEEVEMAAEAVADAGIEPLMTRATAARLRWKEKLGLKEHFKGIVPATYLDALAGIENRMTPHRYAK